VRRRRIETHFTNAPVFTLRSGKVEVVQEDIRGVVAAEGRTFPSGILGDHLRRMGPLRYILVEQDVTPGISSTEKGGRWLTR